MTFEELLKYVNKYDKNENNEKWTPNWEDFTQEKYYIYCNKNGLWNYLLYSGGNQYGIFMSAKCANELVNKLNKKNTKELNSILKKDK